MDDRTLMRISIIIAAAGLVFLFLAAKYAEPIYVPASNIDSTMIGRTLITRGDIRSIDIREGTAFIDIFDGRGSVSIVMFERETRSSPVYTLKTDDTVEVKGKVTIYKGELELQASSITKVS